MRLRRMLGVIVLCGTAGACRPSDESAPPSAVVDSAGVQVVQNRAQRWAEGEAWSVSSEPRLAIGIVDGHAAYQLFQVTAAAQLSDGSVVVVDGGSRTVRRYDATGRFMWASGGPGSGPGEFQQPDQVLVVAGDTLLVWDNALFRATRLSPSGDLMGMRSFDRGAIAKAIDPPLYPGVAELLPTGALLVRLTEKPLTRNGGAKSGGVAPDGRFRRRSGALRVSADLGEIDTLMFFGDVEQFTVTSSMWGAIPFEPPFAKRTSIAIHPREARVCIGDQEAAEVVCLGRSSGVRTVVRWPPAPVAVTEGEIAAWRETQIDVLARKFSREDAALVVGQIGVPEARPSYSQLLLDRGGNLWVELGPASGAESQTVEYLVFDPAGMLLGRVAVPPLRVLEIGDDFVMGVRRDDLDVEHVAVHDLWKPSVSSSVRTR